jgi:uncharacterized protein
MFKRAKPWRSFLASSDAHAYMAKGLRVLASLMLSAWLMGVAGLPHCMVMCAAPCAAARPHGLSWAAVIGRSMGYATLGALAATLTAVLRAWSAWAVSLQPLWIMGLAASMLLGFWMLASGQLPAVLQVRAAKVQVSMGMPIQTPMAKQLRGQAVPIALSTLSGMAWAALPCGLLYSAIVVAMLAPDALQGAAVMLAFSLPGGAMLKVFPTVWQRIFLRSHPKPWLLRWVSQASAMRLSGGMLALAASWALVHRLVAQWQIWCA